MKKFILTSLCLFSALAILGSTPLEARRHGHCCRHSHSSTSVGVSFGQTVSRDVYVVRQYPQPVQTVVYAPQPAYVVAGPEYYTPVYAPTYIVQQPPVVVEEVYVARRPFTSLFSGLSFSWNFFR